MSGTRTAMGIALSALLLAGCGDDDPIGPAAEQNDGGTGTRNMLVIAEVEGQDVPGGFVTTFDVSLRNQAGQPISGATVRVGAGSAGTQNLLETNAGSGDYQAQLNSFPSGNYRLDVLSGDTMKVQGIVVGGIAQHTITSPTANDTVIADQPLVVRWTRNAEARGADIETRDFDVDGIPDTGSFTIPGGDNPARNDGRVRVWRFNRVDIDGGMFGSTLKLSVRDTVEPVVIQ